MSKVLRAAAVSGVLLFSALVPATAAQAVVYPGTCGQGDTPSSNRHYAHCELSYPSTVQAIAYCYKISDDTLKKVAGQPVGPASSEGRVNKWSFAYCPSGYEVHGGTYKTAS